MVDYTRKRTEHHNNRTERGVAGLPAQKGVPAASRPQGLEQDNAKIRIYKSSPLGHLQQGPLPYSLNSIAADRVS
jgi:hypothetical protein